MKSNISKAKNTSSFSLVCILIGIGVTGLSLSITLTQDARWMEWHLSRLGEGAGAAAAVFNYSLVAAAAVLSLVAVRLTDELEVRYQNQPITILRTILLLVAAGWVGIATFPFDRFVITHRVFGYGQMFIVLLLMLTLRHIHTGFSSRTHTIGLVGVIIESALLLSYLVFGVPGLVVVELSGQAILFTWLLSLAKDVGDVRATL